MIDYSNFQNQLNTIINSYEDDTIKCMNLVKHFKSLFDTIQSNEIKYLIECNLDKLNILKNESQVVINKLLKIESIFGGNIYTKLQLHYPLFYDELYSGITSALVEKYNNILYLIIYILEEHSLSCQLYLETGNLAIQLVKILSDEFIEKNKALDELEKLMNGISL